MRVNSFVRTEQDRPHAAVENICGVLVHAYPEERHAVAERLQALPGVEVHIIGDEGKLVLTVEDAEGTWAGATIDQFNRVAGVLSVTMAYHHFDTELEGEIVP